MGLVGYSDSEGSDDETPAPASNTTAIRSSKPAFQKVVDSTAPRRIKVDLPSLAKESTDISEEQPVKRARTGGGLGGFNSFLPAPKRTAETAKKNGLGTGVSLKTSATAAFSREPVEAENQYNDESVEKEDGPEEETQPVAQAEPVLKPAESKPAGNPMKFKPLSVANNKKKPKKKTAPAGESDQLLGKPTEVAATIKPAPAPTPPIMKPKVSLFSVTQEEDAPSRRSENKLNGGYTPLIGGDAATGAAVPDTSANTPAQEQLQDPNSLTAIASDLNLSASERRRLFGRNAKDPSAIKITNFNIDAEYASNEQLRAAGETVEHRAVKSIAPGKHSLQQLVNAASTQKEALEDSWAQGKRNKTEGGSKYGW